MGRGGWMLTACLMMACSLQRPSAGGGPRPSVITPSVALSGNDTTVTISGEHFYPSANADFTKRIQVDATFTAGLGATSLEDVRYVDGQTLTAIVPGSLPPGIYDLTLIDPAG